MELLNLKKCLIEYMKISIGTNIKDGPWGGGNLFAINLTNFLIKKGHEVVSNLNEDDIDIVLLTEPRKTSESSSFTHIDVNNYLNYENQNAIVVHRINECDERKGTDFVNKYLIDVNKSADYTVFVSSWLKSLFMNQGLSPKNKGVILAGANQDIFNSDGYRPWNKLEKMKIVTHHWGANWNKGFEIYSKLDELLSSDDYRNKFEFTYIGNLPKNFAFKNALHIPPLAGKELATELKKNHVYITASINEPSGNHHIEAAQCSLPLLFIESGGIPEYCLNYGLMFNKSNFIKKLNEIYNNYDFYLEQILKYPFNSDKMCDEYLDLFTTLMNNKLGVLKARNIRTLKVNNKFLYRLKKYIFKK
jgi:hypothetical protein